MNLFNWWHQCHIFFWLRIKTLFWHNFRVRWALVNPFNLKIEYRSLLYKMHEFRRSHCTRDQTNIFGQIFGIGVNKFRWWPFFYLNFFLINFSYLLKKKTSMLCWVAAQTLNAFPISKCSRWSHDYWSEVW